MVTLSGKFWENSSLWQHSGLWWPLGLQVPPLFITTFCFSRVRKRVSLPSAGPGSCFRGFTWWSQVHLRSSVFDELRMNGFGALTTSEKTPSPSDTTNWINSRGFHSPGRQAPTPPPDSWCLQYSRNYTRSLPKSPEKSNGDFRSTWPGYAMFKATKRETLHSGGDY